MGPFSCLLCLRMHSLQTVVDLYVALVLTRLEKKMDTFRLTDNKFPWAPFYILKWSLLWFTVYFLKGTRLFLGGGLVFLKYFIYLFLERGRWKEKERERNINVWLPLAYPLLGTWPATQACALTGNLTSNPLVHRPALSPLSHTSQGVTHLFLKHRARETTAKRQIPTRPY